MEVCHASGMATTRDHSQMERRRRKAAGLFEKGLSAPEVARRLGVARQVGYRWREAWQKGGVPALASKGRTGPKQARSRSNPAGGGRPVGRSCRPRLSDPTLDSPAGGGVDREAHGRPLPPRPCLEAAGLIGIQLSAPGTAGRGTGRAGHQPLEAGTLASAKKKPAASTG